MVCYMVTSLIYFDMNKNALNCAVPIILWKSDYVV